MLDIAQAGANARRKAALEAQWHKEVKNTLERRPVLLLLGTSQGLSPAILKKCNGTLPPLRYADSYNHLSVRMAGAIMVDRILGDWD